ILPTYLQRKIGIPANQLCPFRNAKLTFITWEPNAMKRLCGHHIHRKLSKGDAWPVAFSMLLLLAISPSLPAQPDRIHGELNANRAAILKGHVSPRLIVGRDKGPVPPDLTDRKSTRLNSSHLGI